jgi:CRP-like cAMP-binding protein
MLPSPFNELDKNAYAAKTYDEGEFVFRQNDRPYSIYFLQTGIVQLERHTAHGDKVIIHRASEGQTFAEASLFSEAYHCDAVTITHSQIIVLQKSAILNAMRTNLHFAETLTARFAHQVQAYRHSLEIRSTRPAIERVYTAIAQGMLTSDVISLATEIGLTHEATYRALSELVAAGRIRKTARGKYSLA